MRLGRSSSRVRALAEKYIYLTDPKTAEEMEELKNALAKERAKEPVVREVIKEVASPHNIELMEKYNAALREIGALKSSRKMLQVVREGAPEVRTEIKEVERTVTKLVFRRDWKSVAAASVASALVAGSMGAYFF